MNDLDYLLDVYYSEKYLLCICSNIINNISSDNYHDFLLGIFDDIDLNIRSLKKHIINNGYDFEYSVNNLLEDFNKKINNLDD